MNNIEIFKNQILAYLDNELSEQERKALETEIANSRELNEELAAMHGLTYYSEF